MHELRLEPFTLPAATLGPENPLPDLRADGDIHADPIISPGSDFDHAYGQVRGCLPYRRQDAYDHRRDPRTFQAVVLENAVLRATFLPEVGGRLWSLYHKPTGRELLAANTVFQPRNLAIRNAWCSGGVEWNHGITGHSVFTCAPLFAARFALPDGTPVLRMYEWERLRQCPFQLDAYLPAGSPVLFVRVTLQNPHPAPVPMYWWSNIAVPEQPGSRVLVPAEEAFSFGYEGKLTPAAIPLRNGVDVTYPTHLPHAMDFFYHVPAGQHPWIAALDAAGSGLVQTSTVRLRGRKLFVWGMGQGGRNWQDFLGHAEQPYIEIQAGLARTQLEYLPMPAGATWEWVEAYGLLEADPARVHGTDWAAARGEAEERLEALIPRAMLETELARPLAAEPPAELLRRGSGWGALEELRRQRMSETRIFSDALVFDAASLDDEQAPWRTLLETGVFPESDPAEEPGAYMLQEEWQALLERAVAAGQENWTAWLHLGIMRYKRGERAGARAAWERAYALRRNAWALRNLAVLAGEEGREEEMTRDYLAACRLLPEHLSLAVECGRALLAAGCAAAWYASLPEMSPALRAQGRIQLFECEALIALGDLAAAEILLLSGLVLDDLRECERSLSDLWFRLQEEKIHREEGVPIDDALRARVRETCPVPAVLDFRMG